MMDDETAWQAATLNADNAPMPGPVKPASATGGGRDDASAPPDEAYDELESGIASIFAALQAATEEDDAASSEADESRVDAHTFQLLGELDRLWQRSGA